jgi:hypothetical protein
MTHSCWKTQSFAPPTLRRLISSDFSGLVGTVSASLLARQINKPGPGGNARKGQGKSLTKFVF